MAPTIPITEPLKFVAGASWQWDKVLPDFPAGDGWQLSYAFRGETDYDAAWADDVTSPTGEDGFEIRIPPADTAGINPGAYVLWGTVTDGTDTYTPIEWKVNVLPDPTTAVNAKSANQTILDAIEAAISGQWTDAQQKSISIHGRSIENFGPEELEVQKAQYKIYVALEKNPQARLSSAGRFRNPR